MAQTFPLCDLLDMIRNSHIAFVALLCVLIVASTAAQADPGAAPAPNPTLGRGVNVLGYDPIWNDFTKARFQARHFRLIKQGGFDTIRVNLQPFRHMGPAPEY